MSKIQNLIKQFDVSKDTNTYKQIIEEIKSQQTIWIAYYQSTNNYYLDFENGIAGVYIFTEKQFYEEYQDYIMQQQIFVKSEENQVEQRMLLFGDLYRSGFELLIIDNGQTYLSMSLFDVIDKPDLSNIPEINRPVMNPSLVRSANNFFQGLSTKRAIRDMESNMFREIVNAKYLMPLDTSKMNMEKAKAETGKAVVKKKSLMQFPLITNSENKSFYPFFTDWNELAKFDKDKKYSGNIATFEDIKYFFSNADGVVINPFGFNLILDDNMISVIESVAKENSESYKIKEQVAEKDTEVLLGEPADYPQKMIDEISKYLKTKKNVTAAYLKLMIKENEQSYLIVVNFSGDKNEVFGGIAKVGVPFSNGKYLDFASSASDFGKKAIAGIEPFYKKKTLGIFKFGNKNTSDDGCKILIEDKFALLNGNTVLGVTVIDGKINVNDTVEYVDKNNNCIFKCKVSGIEQSRTKVHTASANQKGKYGSRYGMLINGHKKEEFEAGNYLIKRK